MKNKPDKPSLALIYTAIPDYRGQVFTQVYEKLSGKFHIFAGKTHFTQGMRLANLPEGRTTLVDNRFLVGGRLAYQPGVIGKALKSDIVMYEMNPRVISSWLIALACRIKGKPVAAWGHAWPRGRRGERSDRVRGWMRQLADVVVVYTESQVEELREVMPNKPIIAAPNALYTKEQMLQGQVEGVERTDFIFVGRFAPEKKPDLLIRAFKLAMKSLSPSSKLIMVGDGPMREDLVSLVASEGLEDRVELPGWISDFESLKPFYARSIASVSPGFVGLSVTQSFAYGVPMIISRDEPHAPEIEAVKEGVNSVFFKTDSSEALAQAMVDISRSAEEWDVRRPEILRDCAERYSVDHMSDRIIEAAMWALHGHRPTTRAGG